MKILFKAIAFFSLLSLAMKGHAQEKYYSLNFHKEKVKDVFGKKKDNVFAKLEISPSQKSHDGYALLEYPGKSKQQLHDAALKYVRAVKQFVFEDDNNSYVRYSDFAYIGTKEKCFADILALTNVYVLPFDGSIQIAINPQIYSTIFGAKIQVLKYGEVVSVDDVPFNIYQPIQPGNYTTHNGSNGSPFGNLVHKQKYEPKWAYPESVFDPDGNVVNQTNKEIIENFFSNYVVGLKNFLDKNL